MGLLSTNVGQIEVSGKLLDCIPLGFPQGFDDIIETLMLSHGIDRLNSDGWYDFSNFLDLINDIENTFGESTLYHCGKQLVNCGFIETGMPNLEQALKNLEKWFNSQHRKMKICWVDVNLVSLSKKYFEVAIENPYPMGFNRGVLTGLARHYNPFADNIPEVKLDDKKSMPSKGTYIISW